MPKVDHSTLGDANAHLPYRWRPADAAALTAIVAGPLDLHKKALQVDTNTEYVCTVVSPTTFVAVSGSGGGAGVTELQTLSGVAALATDLGTFTGTTIADASTQKSALQSLETAVEAGSPDPDVATLLAGNSGDVLIADGLGGTSAGFTDALNSIFVPAPGSSFSASVNSIAAALADLDARLASGTVQNYFGARIQPLSFDHYMRMTEVAGLVASNEISPGTLDGVVAGDVTLGAVGGASLGNSGGTSYDFGALGGSVTVADDASFNIAAGGSFTITMWAKCDVATGLPTLWTNKNATTEGTAIFYNTSGFFAVLLEDDLGQQNSESHGSAGNLRADGLWHFLAVRWDGSINRLDLFVDLLQEGSVQPALSTISPIRLLIGEADTSVSGSLTDFEGQLHQVGFKHTALSNSVLADLHNGGPIP